MNPIERRAVASLASIFGLRMFGLFMLLPILAIHAESLPGSTPLQIGLALGAYGLTQAIFQIPFGLLSDRLGRKKLITIGLIIFAGGSVVAALAETIEWIIVGRAIQGSGAISSVILALTADLTREEQRTKAMAVIGMSIGFVFLISMTIAPLLADSIGVSGLFIATAGFSVLAILILHGLVPSPATFYLHRDVVPVSNELWRIAKQPQLLQLDLGIFLLHLILTALFVVIPSLLVDQYSVALSRHWSIYLPVILLSVFGMLPLIVIGSKQEKVITVFRTAIGILLLSLVTLALVSTDSSSKLAIVLLPLWLFFVGFNALEAMLPSLISRVAPAASKGTAIGIYNTCQFAGVFVGGICAGIITQRFGAMGVFWFCALLALGWLAMSIRFSGFQLFSSRVIDIGMDSMMHSEALVDRIRQVRGVHEVTMVRGESLAYLKVDDKELDTSALLQLKQTKGGQ